MPEDEIAKNSSISLPGPSGPDNSFLESIAPKACRNLKVLRAVTGITTKELSGMTEIGHSTLRAIETRQRPMLPSHAIFIARATGVDSASLMAGEFLREWGGGKPYTEQTYTEWVGRGRIPTELQKSNQTKQVEHLCEFIKWLSGSDWFLDAHLSLKLMTFTEASEGVLYEGQDMDEVV